LLRAVSYNQVAMHRQLVTIVVGIGCGLALTACGSSGHSTETGASASGSGIAFADCMRANGVPNFPDPKGPGIQISAGSGINPSSPAFQAAQTKCAHLLPGGGPGRAGVPDAQAQAQLLAISKCMRAHGVSGFPDPILSPPSNPGAFSIAMGRGGVFLAVPRTIAINSPAFRKAASACGFGPPRGSATPAP
jgi:hypothetical protein